MKMKMKIFEGDMSKTNCFSLTKPVSIEQMLIFFREESDEVIDYLSKIYGNFPQVIENRRQAILISLKEFQDIFPESKYVVINRMPCRVNTQGNHIDHRGGTTNPVLHRREILSVASAREDSVVLGRDIMEKYPRFSFNILEEMVDAETDWFEYIESEKVKEWIDANRQRDLWWQSYVRAGVLGACSLTIDGDIDDVNGMNIFINGDIPIGGLSSSSALVMVSLLSFCQLNEIEVSRKQFVDIAGDAEWYVGSRGGKGDHAAITFTKQGTISHPSFKPFEINRFIPYPREANFVIVNSARESEKTIAEKSRFNTRVATYEAAQLFFWKTVPEFSRVPLIRDVLKIDRFNVLDKENKIENTINLYNLLKRLPVVSSYSEVMKIYRDCLIDFCTDETGDLREKIDSDIIDEYLALIPEKIEKMIDFKTGHMKSEEANTKEFLSSIHKIENRILKALSPDSVERAEFEKLLKTEKLIDKFDFDDEIQVRQVALYGLAEMIRARLHGDYLIDENYEKVGRLMNASHDGDRRYVLKDNKYVEFSQDFSDQEFDRLIENLQTGSTFLKCVPGGYACSCIELDKGVDIALKTEGTYGAKMVGGGLGGNFIVLSSNPELLLKTLTEEYFLSRKDELKGVIFYDNRKILLKSYGKKDILAEVVVPVKSGGTLNGKAR